MQYHQAILPNPVAEIVFFFLITRMIRIENDITVSTVKLSNILFWQGGLRIAINAPYLLQFCLARYYIDVLYVYLFNKQLSS
jgi:hypothetical protein